MCIETVFKDPTTHQNASLHYLVKRKCHEPNVSFNNNLLWLLMFWLIYVTVNMQIVLLWIECSQFGPLVNGTLFNNALFHFNSNIN